MTPDTCAIDRIAQVLASTGAPGTFATRRTASASELRLDVVGVGPIPLPLSPASARRLCGIAQPARYGLRDQTLLDRNEDDWDYDGFGHGRRTGAGNTTTTTIKRMKTKTTRAVAAPSRATAPRTTR